VVTAPRVPRPDIRDTNRQVIDEYRQHRRYTGAGGMPLVLLTTTGRSSGRPHTTPVAVQVDADRLVVAASMGGLPRHPQWYENALVDPGITVEHRGETFRARAQTVEDPAERDRLFRLMNEVIPDLHRYQEKAADSRQIPIVTLTRTSPS
jgi:deazaflavin-dependent oxidoreductase (nitroreductase family)